MHPQFILIIACCACFGWLALGFSFAQTALLLLASSAVLALGWLAFVLTLACN
jgi:hypothetical protein